MVLCFEYIIYKVYIEKYPMYVFLSLQNRKK